MREERLDGSRDLYLERPDHPVTLDHPGTLDHQVRPDHPEMLEYLARPDPPETSECLGKQKKRKETVTGCLEKPSECPETSECRQY